MLDFYTGSGSAIPDGTWVELDPAVTTFGAGRSVQAAAVDAVAGLVAGVADEAIADGEWGKVVVYGPKTDALVDDTQGTPAAGKVLGISTAGGSNTAGRADVVASAATKAIIGVILADGASTNQWDVFVKCM